MRRNVTGSLRKTIATLSVTILSAAGMMLSSSTVHAQGQNGLKGKIWVRMETFGMANEAWNVPNEKGQDIINMVNTLQPDMITRFFTGDPVQEESYTVPMGHGESPMSFVNYVQAVMNAGNAGCLITPKLALAVESFSYQLTSANDIFNMAVSPQLKALDLDTYYDPDDGNQAADNQQTQNINNVGFKWIGWNFAGGSKDTDGVGAYAYAAVSSSTPSNPSTWSVSTHDISNITAAGIPTVLAHIDYPTAIDQFMSDLTPDQEADVIQSVRLQQFTDGFVFVYPVLYATQGFDASQITTSATGKYNGMTLLQIIAKDITCDRSANPQTCSVP